jgi:DNA repair protein RecN (Recombination protein N)
VIEELHVNGLGVIQDVTLEFAPGLNALTGETGAGKTMISAALSLALGARASGDLVRTGHHRASVEVRLRLPDGAAGLAEGTPRGDLLEWAEDGEVILGRTVRADGRSTARIGGRLAPNSALAAVGRAAVEIHGQRQAEPLLHIATQTAFLDRYAGSDHNTAVGHYRAAYRAWRAAQATLSALDHDQRERAREQDLLDYQVREIEAATVAPGELHDLQAEAARLANVARLQDFAAAAVSALAEEGAGADAAGQAASQLAAAGAIDPAAAALAARATALAEEARDLAAEARTYAESVWADPERLAVCNHRISDIRSLERKYGDGEDGILAYLDQARQRLAELRGDADHREELLASIESSAAEVSALAATITQGRTAAAPALEAALRTELNVLGMRGARALVWLTVLEQPGPDGAESVEFGFSGGHGQPDMALSKVASGGELSRTMLACRSVLADLDDVGTLVFDEVDAGIGGRAAAAVGQRLAKLAETRQVLVVTHLAQIAAHADRHFRVSKEAGTTSVDVLDDEERSAELARMLGGQISEVSLAHARELRAVGVAGRPGGPRDRDDL